MDYKLYILISAVFLFSCQKKVEKNAKIVEPEVIEETIIDQDSIFSDKIMTYILKESKNWPVNYTFEKQEWKVADGKKVVDFNFVDGLVKEVHYFAKDRDNPFSKVEVNYYVFINQSTAKLILKDFREIAPLAVEEMRFGGAMGMIGGKVIGNGFIKTPNILYRQGATVFHIVSDNGVKHIVYRALGKFEQEENIDKDEIASF